MNGSDATIEVERPDGSRATHVLGAETTIGRGTDNSVTLDDLGASRRHARIFHSEATYWIEDLGSRNGTSLNGAAVASHRALRHGDVIQVGKHKLTFQAPHVEAGAVTLDGGSDAAAEPVVAKVRASGYDVASELDEAKPNDAVASLTRHLTALHNVAVDVGTVLELDTLLDKILEHLLRVFDPADAGVVFLRDDLDPNRLTPRARRAKHGHDSGAQGISRTLIRMAMREGQSVLTSDVSTDFDGVKSLGVGHVKSVACVPLICRGERLGVIYLRSDGRRGVFVRDDLRLLTSICCQAAICVKNAKLHQSVQEQTRLRRDFQRYMSPAVAEQIVQKRIRVELGGEHRIGTVCFADIVGFTAMAEDREPGDVVAMLNEYFRLMVGIVFQHGGTVNKFEGDAVLAVWGAPLDAEEGERRACAAAIGMQNAAFQLNTQLSGEQPGSIGMRVGINTGRFMAGNIGSDDRMEYTVIGDAVNLASRVEEQAARAQVLATQATYQAASEWVVAVQLPAVRVKGKAEPVALFSLRGAARRGEAASRVVDLCLPAVCSLEGGGSVEVRVTEARPAQDGCVLTMLAPRRVPPGQLVRVAPQLPELPGLPAFECHVLEQEFELAGHVSPLCSIDVRLVDADERVRALFCPGTLLASTA